MTSEGRNNRYYSKRLRMQRRQRRIRMMIIAGAVIVIFITIGAIMTVFWPGAMKSALNGISQNKQIDPEETGLQIQEEFLTVNPYSRPGEPLKKIKNVVVHYTANPGTDAMANRNYFEGLKDTQITYASSHYIIGLDGTIIQCIPLDEICYGATERNIDSVSIECCHPDETGEFTKETYDALIKLTAWLCGEYNLKEEHVIRHYDVKGKACPLYYVEHEDEWAQLREDVMTYLDKHGK